MDLHRLEWESSVSGEVQFARIAGHIPISAPDSRVAVIVETDGGLDSVSLLLVDALAGSLERVSEPIQFGDAEGTLHSSSATALAVSNHASEPVSAIVGFADGRVIKLSWTLDVDDLSSELTQSSVMWDAEGPQSCVTTLEFIHESRTVLVGRENGFVSCLSSDSDDIYVHSKVEACAVMGLSLYNSAHHAMSFFAAGRFGLVACNNDQVAPLGGRVVWPSPSAVTCVAPNSLQGGQFVVCGDVDGRLSIFRSSDHAIHAQDTTTHTAAIVSIRMLPRGMGHIDVIAASSNGKISVHTFTQGQLTLTSEFLAACPVSDVDVSPHANFVIAATPNGVIAGFPSSQDEGMQA